MIACFVWLILRTSGGVVLIPRRANQSEGIGRRHHGHRATVESCPQRGSTRRTGRKPEKGPNVFRSSLSRFLLIAILFTAVVGGGIGVADAQQAHYYATESAAQHHCPRDTVVWLNVPTGIYHYQGERWYGRTRHGTFVCEKEAIEEGDRASRNGQ